VAVAAQPATSTLCNKHGNAVIPLVIDLLDRKDGATLLPRVLEKAGQLDILHANACTYVGGRSTPTWGLSTGCST
jgi:ribitol 2-dehydrogenase